MRVTHIQRDLPLLHSLSFSLSLPHSHIPTDAPTEQAMEKTRLFAHTVPVPEAPGEYSTPPALLSHSANKPHARMLFELSPTVATHLSVSSGSRCLFFGFLSFTHTDIILDIYLWPGRIVAQIPQLLWPWLCPPWLQHALFGQTNTKKTICKKQVYALCDFDRYWWSKPHSHPLRTVVYVGCEFNKRSASIRGHVTSPPDPTLRWQAWKPNVRQGVTLEVMRGQVTLGLRRAVAKRLLAKCWVFRY